MTSKIPSTTTAMFDPQQFLKDLTSRPGVYRMLNAQGEVIYVGKARNLKKRVTSYFRTSGLSAKTQALVALIAAIDITATHNENDALLLENDLIKQYKPRYNILLRDDKSYPYIYFSTLEDFPRMGFHRGAKREPGRYFGPYPSAGAVRETLNLLQKVFLLRQCEDSYFRNRSRPCLQYQIKRCTAPCVGLIDKDNYHNDVRHAMMFLEGKDRQVIEELVKRMDLAAQQLDYEKAAHYRDQIASLRHTRQGQYTRGGHGDLDVVACRTLHGMGCVQVFFIRGGRNLGNKAFFPKHDPGDTAPEILTAFLSQYYLGKDIPPEIIINQSLEEEGWLREALSGHAHHPVALSSRPRGAKARWLALAENNAELALKHRLAAKTSLQQRFELLQEALDLDSLPQRLECFDISHTAGELTVAACVVFDSEGPVKSSYRRYNIEGITPGDDYAALYQALTRRFLRLNQGEGQTPDVLFIDGGKGQLKQAVEVLQELQISGITVVAIAKGPERKPGLETLFLSGRREAIILPSDAPALHLIQHIRDEAHRFAITGHRQRRSKARQRSPLEQIPGLGPKRRRQLLTQLGGLQEVIRAEVEELAKVPGISLDLAQRIYDVLHGDTH